MGYPLDVYYVLFGDESLFEGARYHFFSYQVGNGCPLAAGP